MAGPRGRCASSWDLFCLCCLCRLSMENEVLWQGRLIPFLLIGLEGIMVLVLVKSVSDWNSDLFERSVFSLVLATTGIQQDVQILCLQIEASRDWESKWVYSLLTQIGDNILGMPCGNLGNTGRGQQGRQSRWRSCQLPANCYSGAV